jgi:MarR family transcriptional regulator for hemolysin
MIPVFEHIFYGQNLYERTVIPVCKAYGLTYMEFTVLMFLKNNPQYDTAAQIVKVRRLTKSHVSVSLKGLQERGLVQGFYFPGNQKTLHLQLTEQAIPVVEAGLAAQKEFGNKLIRGFTQEEVNQLQKLTEKLYDNMKREEECNG